MNWIKIAAVKSVFIIASTQLFAQKSEPAAPKEDFLVIQGIVVDDEARLEGVTIRLFKGNSKIDSIYTGKNGAFQFTLGKDYYYAIEYSRIGYENTCVLINTNRWDVDPQNEDNGYQVDFEVELISEIPNKNNLNLPTDVLDALDFPKVMIGYKAGEDEGFYSDKKYMKTVKESLKKIKDTAKAK
ncbi:MAG TPA: hypothetical protein PK323_01490 [Bacteroidia bacterium]|nr:hypothetical protein [Bacteroidia bacterium]